MNHLDKVIDLNRVGTNRLGDNILYLLKKHHLTDNELAESVKLPIITIRRIISGETTDPRISTLKLIANYFSVTVDELLHSICNNQNNHPIKNKPKFLPILDWITAAKISSLKEIKLSSWEKWHPITFAYEYSLSDDAFILESTPSMYPRFSTGTLFVIEPNISPRDGDIILIKSNSCDDISLRELMIDLPERKLLPLMANSSNIKFEPEIHSILGVVTLTLLYKR